MANPKKTENGVTTTPDAVEPVVQPDNESAETSIAEEPSKVEAFQPKETRKSGGFVGMVLGGIIAAGIGFGLARFVVPEGWPMPVSSTASADFVALQDQVATLATRLDAPQAAIELPDDLDARLMAAEAAIADLVARPNGTLELSTLEQGLATLREEVANLKASNVGISAEAEAEMQAKIDAAAAEADQARAETEKLAATAARNAVISDLEAAVTSGAPLNGLLAALPALGITAPEILVQNESGIPTLATLQDSFPDAARAALEASLRADMGETTTDRIASFLQTQLGARSLEPREGTDVDAVLSRIEGAVRQGELARALTMLPELPPPGQEALTPWVTQVQTHLAASDAIAALTKAE